MATALRFHSAGPWLAVVAVVAAAAAALTLAACGGRAKPTPRTVDVTAIAEDELVAAILDECHKPLRGHMDRLAATVALGDGSTVDLFVSLPDQLRSQSTGGSFLLVGEQGFKLADATRTDLKDGELAHLQQLRALLDAAAFGPLYRATACHRLGPDTFLLTQPTGPPCTLRLRPGCLLPASLSTAVGDVRIVDYERTSTTWIVKQAEVAQLGLCTIALQQGKLSFQSDFFAPPGQPREDLGGPLRRLPTGEEPRSPVPFFVEAPTTQWACAPAPDGWTARTTVYAPLHQALEAQDLRITGFPIFWQEDGKSWLACPFRQRKANQAYTIPAGSSLRTRPPGRWLVVYPPAGDLPTRCAEGERLLREALATNGLSPQSAILTQPFLHLDEGAPTPDKLASPVVRMSVAVP